MAEARATPGEKVVRDSKSGRSITVRGAGALKGHLRIRKGVDLTKPIASQTLKGSNRPTTDPGRTKR